MALLRMSHVAIQIQSQGPHGKVLKASHSTWNLSVCLWGPIHQLAAGPRAERGGGAPRGEEVAVVSHPRPSPGGKAHLLIQAHEGQSIAGILHLVHDARAEHRGREGNGDGPVLSSRDDLAGTQKPGAHWRARAATRGGSYPCILTTCVGLMWYMWSEGTASCPCRMTEMS